MDLLLVLKLFVGLLGAVGCRYVLLDTISIDNNCVEFVGCYDHSFCFPML